MAIVDWDFLKRKWPILIEAQERGEKVQGAVAGKGFFMPPGYLSAEMTVIERIAKMTLMDARLEAEKGNQDRIVAIQKHEDAMTLAGARRDWDLEKAGLLDDLARKLAAMEYAFDMRRIPVEAIAVEIALLRATLTRLKTAIEIEAAGIREEIELAGQEIPGWQLKLSEAKLATAEARSGLIPLMLELVEKQGDLLEEKEKAIPYIEDYLVLRGQIADAKEALIPYIQAHADKMGELADAILQEIEFKEKLYGIDMERALTAALRAEEARLQAVADRERTGIDADRIALELARKQHELAVAQARRSLEALRLELLRKTGALRNIEHSIRLDQGDARIDAIAARSEAEAEADGTIRGIEMETRTAALDGEKARKIGDVETDETIVNADVGSDISTTKSIGATRRTADEQAALIRATANITSELVHILVG